MTFPPQDVRLPCGDSPHLFHPRTYGETARRQVDAAKAICGKCPWRHECLTDALERGETEGILGGLTPYQRTRLTNRTANAA